MRKRVKAQITVYAALSIILVITLVCTCIGSAAVSAKQAHMEAAAALSTESVFAGYSNKLLEEFDIFALKKTEGLQTEFEEYIQKNIESGDTQGIELISSKLDNYTMMTDNGGECIYQEILSYMKYGIYAEAAAYLAGLTKEQEKSEAVNEITQEIIDCEELLCEQDEYILGIIQKVEGIRVDNSGLVIHNGNAVSVDSYFVKAALSKPLSMESAGITSEAVYEGIKSNGKFTDVVQLVCDLEEDIEEYKQSGDEEYCEAYKSSRQQLNEVLSKVLEITQSALKDLESFEAVSKSALTKIESCMTVVKDKKETLGEDVYEAFAQDITEMKEQQESQKSSLCDTDKLKSALSKRETIISAAYYCIQELETTPDTENCDSVQKALKGLKEILQKIDNSDLIFDYSQVDFSEKKSGIKKIKELYEKITDGVCGLVLEKDKISSKEISYTDLADKSITDNTSLKIQIDGGEIIYNEYLFIKFLSYTDYIQEDSEQDSGKLLDYTLEYILYGKNSDKENINSSVMELALLREGMNMAYLITDSAKRKEAEVLAASLVGFTGNVAVVKAAKYLIMGAWAFGESILELKRLYKGEKVELIKTKENWELSLKKLLDMDFSQEKSDKEAAKGMTYEEYLRMLLLLKNPKEKYYRTMAAMELRMIELGLSDFRMRNYIYAAEGKILYSISGLKQYGEKTVSYSYG